MSANKMSFQVYADGKRRILVVENCEGETLEQFNRILNELCSGSDRVTEIPAVSEPTEAKEAPDISAMEKISDSSEDAHGTVVSFPDIVISDGDYAGMTPTEAVEKHGITAVLGICEWSKQIDSEEMRSQVVSSCKRMVADDLSARRTQSQNADEIKGFLKLYKGMVGGKGLKALEAKTGITSIEGHLRCDDKKILSIAYSTVLDDLRKRTAA